VHIKNKVNNVQLYRSSISFLDDCGDHVVVINSKDIALPGDEWRKRVYFHHTGYPGGATWTLAWELHDKDPTMVRD
jgi:large subunit ribosomal protein L13